MGRGVIGQLWEGAWLRWVCAEVIDGAQPSEDPQWEGSDLRSRPRVRSLMLGPVRVLQRSQSGFVSPKALKDIAVSPALGSGLLHT